MINNNIYDLIIIGGGPAGVSAGVYAARKKIKSLLITESFGGQSIVSKEIQNWIGTKAISGIELAKNLEDHIKSFSPKDIDIIEFDLVKNILKKEDNLFEVETYSSGIFITRTILLATGSKRRRLNIEGESEFDGRGVVWCATCDAPLFQDKNVVVVGGGNSGLEAVLDLTKYAKNIHLIHRNNFLKGDASTIEKIKRFPNVNIILNSEPRKIIGSSFVNSLIYFDKNSQEEKELEVEGIFIEIGNIPNADFVGDLVNKNSLGEVIVDKANQKTSCEGIWAAGDITDSPYRQNNISAGDAIKAILNIQDYLHKK